MNTQSKAYIKALDSLRVIAISAVVMIHTTTRTIETTKDNLLEFPWTLFLNQITRFCVPLFFMVSGFALELNYDYHANYLSYLKKRGVKVIVPFVFWSLIYYYFVYTKNHDNIFWVILTGNASYQLYFIPALVIFYMAFPLLHKLYKYLAMPISLIFLTGVEIALLYRDYYIKEFDLLDPLRIVILAYIYFIIGMVAARNKDKIIEFVKKWKLVLIGISLTSGTYVFMEGLTKFLVTDNYLTFYSSWRPSTFIYTIAAAITLFYVFDKSHLQFSVAKWLSDNSFFVFFVHVSILEIIWNSFGHVLFNIMSNNAIGKFFFDPIFFVVVISLSFLTAFIIRRIPHIKTVTG